MCRRKTCRSCHKPTWAGCGAHVEQVLGDVPKNQRCSCSADHAAVRQPAAQRQPAAAKSGLWSRLRGRGTAA